MTIPRPQTGTCTDCGGTYEVTDDRIVGHYRRSTYGTHTYRCPGSRQPPMRLHATEQASHASWPYPTSAPYLSRLRQANMTEHLATLHTTQQVLHEQWQAAQRERQQYPSVEGHFVAPDADERPCIWHEPYPNHPTPTCVMVKPPARDPMRWVWDTITSVLPHRTDDDTEEAPPEAVPHYVLYEDGRVQQVAPLARRRYSYETE